MRGGGVKLENETDSFPLECLVPKLQAPLM